MKKDAKCDRCEKQATVHCVEIIKGQKVEKHLCDEHAEAAGLADKSAPKHQPVSELLSNFVKLHSGASSQSELVCEECGMTFGQFREQSLMGCANCYKAFESQLMPLLEKAQEGGTHHLGKVPRRAGAGEARQNQLLRLRKRLTDAVNAEDYELAARLRDEIRRSEGQTA